MTARRIAPENTAGDSGEPVYPSRAMPAARHATPILAKNACDAVTSQAFCHGQYGCRPNRDPTRWGGAGAPSQVFCAARSWRRGNSLAPSMFDFLGVERPQGAEPKNKTICQRQMVLFLSGGFNSDISLHPFPLSSHIYLFFNDYGVLFS